MKKLIALLCSLVMCVCLPVALTACDSDNGDNNSNNNNSNTNNNSNNNSNNNGNKEEEKHTHSYGEWSVETEPTCKTTGKRTQKCECGDVKSETIPVTDNHTGEWTDSVPATCRAAGLQKRTCTVCGKAETKVSPVKDHTYSGEVCTTCGFTERGTSGITYSGSSVTGGSGLSGDVVIPEKYNNRAVTRIENNAFYNNNQITSITIPSSVTFIGNSAFFGCGNLKTIYYNAANATVNVNSFPGGTTCNVFGSCGENVEGGMTIVIGSAVKKIPEHLFDNFYSADMEGDSQKGLSVKEIVFSTDTVLETIGFAAFEGCHGFKKLIFPASLKVIENSAFDYCSTTSIEFAPNSKLRTLKSAFQYNMSLTTVVIPASTYEVYLSAFYTKTNTLQSVKFEKTNGWIMNNGGPSGEEYDVSSSSHMAGIMRGALGGTLYNINNSENN